jgi:hypothetical protein
VQEQGAKGKAKKRGGKKWILISVFTPPMMEE